MPAADTAKLIASLSLKDGFTGPLKTMDKQLSKFDAHLKATDTRGTKIGKQIGTGIKAGAVLAAAGIGFLASQVGFGLASLSKLEDADAQTNAVLKSTKGIAGVTGKEVRALAEDFENLNATIDDKVIQSGENLLLTFTNIRKDAFEPTLQAALDLNAALGKGEEGLQGTITQVGKALNDPAKGLTALRRVGVAFTDDQVKQIKALQESGDLLGAQRIILRELGTEFGGSFAAKGKTATGTIAGIGDAAEDLQKTVATGLFPTIQKLLPRIREALSSPVLLHGVEHLGDAIGDLFSDQNINEGARILGGLFDTARSLAPVIASAAQTTGAFIKTAVDAFRSLPPEIQALAVAGFAVNKLTGGLVTNIAGGLISAVISSFKGLMNVNAAAVTVTGPVTPSAAFGSALGAIMGPFIVAAVAAIAVKTLTDEVNNAAADQGLKTNFMTPGSGFLPFGIEASLHNIGEVIGTFQQLERQGDHTTDAIETARRDANRKDDRTFDSIEKLRGAVTSETLSVAVQGPVHLSKADVRAVITADQRARGITPSGPSKTLRPRFDFLAGSHSGSKDVAVADALALGFERGKTPAFRSTENLKAAIKAVSRDIRTLPPKFTGPLGADLTRLKNTLARKIEQNKPNIHVTVPVSTKTFVNGRLLDSANGRFTSTIVGSKGSFEFG